jgi:hypothetical protein
LLGALALAALAGVVHVHHAPSHDSDAPFAAVLDAAFEAGLDFVVLTEHAPDEQDEGPLPAADRAGLYHDARGRAVLVLVGVELGTRDGHLLALDLPGLVPATGRRGRDVIRDVHARGGFAVVPHPFSHGGWHDWEAPFDGLEVHNNATELRRRMLGPLLPLRLLRMAFDRDAVMRELLQRPDRELERADTLFAAGRRFALFSGADAHQNARVLGLWIEPYLALFRAVQMRCEPGPLEPAVVWSRLRHGQCAVRYALYESRATEALRVAFPSGREELQLDGGGRVLEIGAMLVADDAHRPAQ